MEYFWKENRPYVLAVGAGVVAFFFYHAFVIGPLRAKGEAAASKRKFEAQVFTAKAANGVPTRDSLDLARRELERTRAFLSTLRGEVGFKEGAAFPDEGFPRKRDPERYEMKKGDSLENHYANVKINLYGDLQQLSVKNRIPFPAHFGLEAVADKPGEEAASALLRRLMVVERVVGLAVKEGVERIDAIEALHETDLNQEGALGMKGAFLNRDTVLFRCTGPALSIFRLLHAVQKKGAYLAVSKFEVSRKDPAKDALSAMMAVTLLTVDEKAPIEPKPEAKP